MPSACAAHSGIVWNDEPAQLVRAAPLPARARAAGPLHRRRASSVASRFARSAPACPCGATGERHRADLTWHERAALLRQLPMSRFDLLPDAERVAVSGYFRLDAPEGDLLPALPSFAKVWRGRPCERRGAGSACNRLPSWCGDEPSGPWRAVECSVYDQPTMPPQVRQAPAHSPRAWRNCVGALGHGCTSVSR